MCCNIFSKCICKYLFIYLVNLDTAGGNTQKRFFVNCLRIFEKGGWAYLLTAATKKE